MFTFTRGNVFDKLRINYKTLQETILGESNIAKFSI